MPIITTKLGIREVADDDMIALVVPGKYANPKVHKASATARNYVAYVTYWDDAKMRNAYKSFDTRAGAVEFADSVRAGGDIIHRMNVKDILANHSFVSKHLRLHREPTEYPSQAVPLDPRYLGLWLGDGHSRCPSITNIDPEIIKYVETYAQGLGLRVVQRNISYFIATPKGLSLHKCADPSIILAVEAVQDGMTIRQAAIDFGFAECTISQYAKMARVEGLDVLHAYFAARTSNHVLEGLQQLNLIKNKHIPDVYKKNTREVRLLLLGGMLDTDGYLDRGGYEVVLADRRLLEDVAEVARSLGFHASDVKQVKKVCTNAKGGPKVCVAFQTRIMGGWTLRDIPLLVPHKRLTCDPRLRTDQLHFTITP